MKREGDVVACEE